MDSRKLNRLITIRNSAPGQDAIGQPVQTWVVVAKVWADILFISGAESIRADKETSITKASMRIRRRTDLDAGMQVLFETTVYEIKAVLPNEQFRDKVDLSCEIVDG